MNLPNPYASGNYKKLIVIPAVLVVAAILLIALNGLHQGVDLKGGVLFTAITDQHVDVVALQSEVAKLNPEADVRIFANPAGTGVEVQLPNSDKLAVAEENVKKLQSMESQLKDLEVNASILEAQNSQTPSQSLTQQLQEVARRQITLNAEVISLSQATMAQLKPGTQLPSEAHAAVRAVVTAYGEAQDSYRNDILAAVERVVHVKSHSFREVGPSLSRFFLDKAKEILIYAFILSAIAVFAVFRGFVPSAVVIIGAVADIVITAGAMSLFGIPLTLASVAGLLMLIGFSLDTDVMLTMRVLKRQENTPRERAFDAFKTGALMNLTSIGAFCVLAVTGLILQIPIYYQLGIVAVIGSIVDFAATWGVNAVLVLNYIEKKQKIGTGN